jgi:hypothetical protein
MPNLVKATWSEIDPGEIRLILFERISRPGQYRDRANNPGKFYLPLADSTCRIVLGFDEAKKLLTIEPGPAFDAVQWDDIVREIESRGPLKVGRDCSFSSFRVTGSWMGARSGVQILAPPADSPVAPAEMADHPFIIEFPVKVCDRWPITNYRRMRNHSPFDLTSKYPARRQNLRAT